MATLSQGAYSVHGTVQCFYGTLDDYQYFNSIGTPIRSGTIVVDISTTPNTVLGISNGAGGLYAFSPLSMSPMPQSKASVMTAQMKSALSQAATNGGGYLAVTTPGKYYFNELMVRPANTTIYVGTGVELIVADGTNAGMFINAAAIDPGTLILVGEMSWNIQDPYYGVTINHAGIGTLFPVGSFIAVAGTTSHDYGGIWPVVVSSANSIVYQIRPFTPDNGSGIPQGLGSTLRVYPVDRNIHICGPGKLNGNGSNNGIDGAGNPVKCLIWTRNAINATIRDIEIAPGTTWSIASNNVRAYRVQDIFPSSTLSGSTDNVHLSGGHDDAIVERIDGVSSDNMVGLTIDVTGGTIYDFAYQQPGDMRGVVIRNIKNLAANATGAGAASTIGIYGPAGYRYNDITIEDVDSGASNAVLVSTYSPTNMENTNGGVLTMRRIRGNSTGETVKITGTAANWNRIVVDDVQVPNQVALLKADAGGTIGSLVCRGFNNIGNTVGTSQVVLGASNVTAFTMQDEEGVTLAANVKLVNHSGAGTVGKASFINVSATGPGTAAVYGGTAPTLGVQYFSSFYNGAALP